MWQYANKTTNGHCSLNFKEFSCVTKSSSFVSNHSEMSASSSSARRSYQEVWLLSANPCVILCGLPFADASYLFVPAFTSPVSPQLLFLSFLHAFLNPSNFSRYTISSMIVFQPPQASNHFPTSLTSCLANHLKHAIYKFH